MKFNSANSVAAFFGLLFTLRMRFILSYRFLEFLWLFLLKVAQKYTIYIYTILAQFGLWVF